MLHAQNKTLYMADFKQNWQPAQREHVSTHQVIQTHIRYARTTRSTLRYTVFKWTVNYTQTLITYHSINNFKIKFK